MPKAKTTKRATVEAPQNLAEAAQYIRMLGASERAINVATATMEANIEEIKRPFTAEIEQHQRMITQLVEGLYVFAHGHRAELTENGKKKTVALATGSFSWRLTPKSVRVKDVKGLIARLKQLKLDRFIRVKEDVDREAMLKEEESAAAVDGVTIEQHEEFVVKPTETKVGIAAAVGKRSLKLTMSSGGRRKRAAKKSA